MALTLNLLFHLHHETEAERPTPRGYAEVPRLIVQADDLPIGCAWLAEHHLDPMRGRLPAPLLLAVAAARETRRIRVGPCVLVLPLRHPLAAAEELATADVLMGGRLAAGVGSGGNPEEFAAFGVPLDERRARYAESLDIVTRALRGERFGHMGDYYQFPDVALVPQPLQPLGELLWVAASSVTAATLAGHSGGNLLLSRGMPLDALREQIAAYRAARPATTRTPRASSSPVASTSPRPTTTPGARAPRGSAAMPAAPRARAERRMTYRSWRARATSSSARPRRARRGYTRWPPRSPSPIWPATSL